MTWLQNRCLQGCRARGCPGLRLKCGGARRREEARRDVPGRAQAYLILDEFILAGELQETSKQVILDRVSKADSALGDVRA